tara:strand:+ start:311 stop:472 length:162 start_codon:yes stop_codon:yes gene_type:complete
MPRVVIEEFVPDENQAEDCECDQVGTAHKVMTHHEIDDVSIFQTFQLNNALCF